MDIVKWGNSAAIRLPALILEQLGVQVGDALAVEVANGALTLRPVMPRSARCADAAVAAIDYALKLGFGTGGDVFLAYWQQGAFAKIRAEWPDVPEAVFNGADTSRQEV